jgi:hypothetical protein
LKKTAKQKSWICAKRRAKWERIDDRGLSPRFGDLD